MTIPREHIANLDREGNVASLGASNLNDKLRDFDEKFVDKLRSLSIGSPGKILTQPTAAFKLAQWPCTGIFQISVIAEKSQPLSFLCVSLL